MSDSEFNVAVVQCQLSLEPQALRLTRDREKANDLLQETTLKAMMHREKFREGDGSNLKAWMFTIMKNTYLTQCRRKSNRRRLLSAAGELAGFGPSDTLGHNQGDHLLVSDSIDRALSKIRYEHRTPFLMFFKGYAYEEIAQILNLPVGTVKSQIHQARKKLQGFLKDFADRKVGEPKPYTSFPRASQTDW